MIKKVIYAGTFDPITRGHLDIVERSLKLFDEVIIAVAESKRKQPMFDVDARVAMVAASIEEAKFEQVSVESYSGLTIEFAKKHDVRFFVRGLRSPEDFGYESKIAHTNFFLSERKIETIFFSTSMENFLVSSSMVRELIAIQALDQVAQFVPKAVLPFLSR